jgi:hypothetical protein
MPQNGANEEKFSPSFCVYLVCVRIVGVKPKFDSVSNYELRVEGIYEYVDKAYKWLFNSALSGDEWLASHLGCFTHRQIKYPWNRRLSGPRI